jgi:hypothetical protein
MQFSGSQISNDEGADITAIDLCWSSNDAAGAFSSPLELHMAGAASAVVSSTVLAPSATIWLSAVSDITSLYLHFGSSNAGMNRGYRANRFSVRWYAASRIDTSEVSG